MASDFMKFQVRTILATFLLLVGATGTLLAGHCFEYCHGQVMILYERGDYTDEELTEELFNCMDICEALYPD